MAFHQMMKRHSLISSAFNLFFGFLALTPLYYFTIFNFDYKKKKKKKKNYYKLYISYYNQPLEE